MSYVFRITTPGAHTGGIPAVRLKCLKCPFAYGCMTLGAVDNICLWLNLHSFVHLKMQSD
jgi:hypothetical protein